jgi:hypothetical protein
MIRSKTIRRRLLAVAAGIAILIVLHPPWIARAVAMRMNFDGFPTARPTTVVDTVEWAVPFAPIYARPTLSLDTREFKAYQARLSKGDTAAAREWQREIEGIERRYRVPDTLRSEWSMNTTGTAPIVAYRRKIVSAQFEIDAARLGVYLLVVIAVTAVAAVLTSRLSA